jgi:hypothetical protein
MNAITRRTLPAAVLGATVFLSTACSGSGTASTYTVTGTVRAKWIEQECKTFQHRPVSAGLELDSSKSGGTSGKSGSSSSSKSSSSSGGSSGGSSSAPKIGTGTGSSASGSGKLAKSDSTKSVSKNPSKSPSKSTGKTGNGASTWKAPKPVKIRPNQLPTHRLASPTPTPHGSKCKTEYELAIENADGIFEQDVNSWDYWSCDEYEKFDKCTLD